MYTESFKDAMVVKMTIPGGVSAAELSRNSGISQPTLSKWKKAHGKIGGMARDRGKRRPQDWTAEEKLKAIVETMKMGEEELGTYLRREGLHSSHLELWTRDIIEGLRVPGGRGKRRVVSEEKRKIKVLEREVRRKDKALAEATALLILKKKADLIWGVAEDEESP